ncbi:MAG: DNA mismatch repair protein MutS [Deinococcales bacterium]|nr:DNA mismatch repair protein MutS [Chitinophagaceae bacterium]
MQVDKTTLQDLSIFHTDEDQSVFHHLNFTQTNDGREYLRWVLSKPLDTITEIQDVQQTIQLLSSVIDIFPATITNGTMLVIDKFYETQLDTFPAKPNGFNSLLYTVLSKSDFSITKYSVTHFIIFFKGLQQIASLLQQQPTSKQLQSWCDNIVHLQSNQHIQTMLQYNKKDSIPPQEIIAFGGYLRYHFKEKIISLMDIYARLDAYLSLAIATKKYQFTFPEIALTKQPYIKADGLWHILLNMPISYDVSLNKDTNFLFLTGANMAGKSTFIKAVGICVYLAHIGMGVPAKNMQLSLFNGLLSNINVTDNIIKGESYFFNEVQRIKNTIEKISDGNSWLILIDELFKGTNVQDAMKCSTTVIEGLHKMKNAVFILSTHLYEIGEQLQQYPNIDFRFFETSIADNELVFSYQLKKGISNDRLGYLILKKEGVVALLEKL